MNLYAMLYELSDGTLEHSERCKSVECAVKLINPLTDGGKTLLGHAVLYPNPSSALMWLHKQTDEVESILAAPQAAPAGMVLVPRETLKWWRDLVDLNPADLAPRIDRMLAAAPAAQLAEPVSKPPYAGDMTNGECADKLQKFLDVMKENDPAPWPRGMVREVERAVWVLRNPPRTPFICECERSPARENWGRGGKDSVAAAPAVVVDEAAVLAELLAAIKERDEANAAWDRFTGSARQYPGSEYQRARKADERYSAAIAAALTQGTANG